MESRPSRARRSRQASPGADEAILARFAAIRVWTRGGERAPHKALLLLHALAALQRREPRLIPFARLEEAVGRLLRDFGPPRSTNPAYPFWHLQSDGVWEIPQREALQHDLDIAPWRHNPRVSVIREVGAQGGLDAQLFTQLRARPDLVNRAAAQVLRASFPASVHEDLLDAVGMPWVPAAPVTSRDAAFRQTILRIYRHQCGVCGYDGQLGSVDLGIAKHTSGRNTATTTGHIRLRHVMARVLGLCRSTIGTGRRCHGRCS